MQGRNGNDAINGGSGDDTLVGGLGNDQIDGGDGAGDTAVFASTFSASTIVYNAGTGEFTISSAVDGTDTIVNVENFQFADVLKTAAQLAVPDTTAPQLLGLSPLDDATDVQASSNIVLSFDEFVKAGIGNIVIYNSNNTIARTISVTDTTQVTFAGATVTINAASDLAPSSGYYVNLAAGVIKDFSGNDFAGISGDTAFNFTTAADTVAPTLSNLAPLDNATGVATTANIVLTFSETVQAGSGNIVIFNGNGTVNQTIAVADSSQVSVSGNIVTINPADNLLSGSGYYVNIDGGAFQDLATNSFAGISGATSYNFTTLADTTAPGLTALSPADNATGVQVNANIVLTFNEAVKAGTGNFGIFNSKGAVVQTIAVTDTNQVTFSGNTVTINPNANLGFGTGYYVNIASGVIKDLSGNSFLGISGKTAFDFTTLTDVTAPTLSSFTPADNTTGVAIDLNLTLSFSETVQAGSGNITVFNSNGTVAKTMAVTDTSQVSFSGSTVTINPTTDLAPGHGYYVNLAAGAIKDLAGLSFAGISGATAFNFTTFSELVPPQLNSVTPGDDAANIAVDFEHRFDLR